MVRLVGVGLLCVRVVVGRCCRGSVRLVPVSTWGSLNWWRVKGDIVAVQRTLIPRVDTRATAEVHIGAAFAVAVGVRDRGLRMSGMLGWRVRGCHRLRQAGGRAIATACMLGEVCMW